MCKNDNNSSNYGSSNFNNNGDVIMYSDKQSPRLFDKKRDRAEIFYRFINGESQKSLGDLFGVCPQSISNAIRSYLYEEASMNDFYLYMDRSGKFGSKKFTDLDKIKEAIQERELHKNEESIDNVDIDTDINEEESESDYQYQTTFSCDEEDSCKINKSNGGIKIIIKIGPGIKIKIK